MRFRAFDDGLAICRALQQRAYFVVLVSGQENDCGGTHQINFISRANRLSRERKTTILLGVWEFRNPAHSWFWVLEYEL
jgi:hypothetical protein